MSPTTGQRHRMPSAPACTPPSPPRGPLCAGIDPHAALLRDWGLDDDVAGLERFALGAVEGLAPARRAWSSRSPPSTSASAAAAIAVLERVVADVPGRRRAGAARRQARRHRLHLAGVRRRLPRPGLTAGLDAITLSPYLGFGSLDPFVDTARRHDAGLFVLALTSNKEGPEVQHARPAAAAPWPGASSTGSAP